MLPGRLWLVAAFACLAATAGFVAAAESSVVEAPSAVDPRVRPGATFEVEFPELPKTRSGKVSSIRVKIPSGYTPEKLFPLIAWMGGADGGSDPGPGAALVDAGKFICVGLPFPVGCNNPRQANMVGDFQAMWDYHQTMLEELERLIPNISPAFRVVAGFSNGAHTIAGYMALAEPNQPPGFTTYILAEGGNQGDFRHLAGRHVCVAWGELGRSNKPGSLQLAAAAEAAQLKVHRVLQPGVGHAFDPAAKAAVREWLQDAVIASLIAEAREALEKNSAAGRAAAKQLEVLAEGPEAESAFKEALAAADRAAEEEFRALEARLAGKPATANRTATAESLRVFLKSHGSPPERTTPQQRAALAGKCRKFVADWPGTTGERAALALLGTLGQTELDDALARLPANLTPDQRWLAAQQLRMMRKRWEGTPVAGFFDAAITRLERP
jgi:dienelactone hydrolase